MVHDPTPTNDDKLNELLELHRRELLKHMREAVRHGQGAELDRVSARVVLGILMVVEAHPQLMYHALVQMQQEEQKRNQTKEDK